MRCDSLPVIVGFKTIIDVSISYKQYVFTYLYIKGGQSCGHLSKILGWRSLVDFSRFAYLRK